MSTYKKLVMVEPNEVSDALWIGEIGKLPLEVIEKNMPNEYFDEDEGGYQHIGDPVAIHAVLLVEGNDTVAGWDGDNIEGEACWFEWKDFDPDMDDTNEFFDCAFGWGSVYPPADDDIPTDLPAAVLACYGEYGISLKAVGPGEEKWTGSVADRWFDDWTADFRYGLKRQNESATQEEIDAWMVEAYRLAEAVEAACDKAVEEMQ